jgi:hypothetical protein
MSEMEARDIMQQAYQHIKRGRQDEAITLLMPLLDEFGGSNAAVWWLMANAAEGRSDEDMLISLENCYNLQPDHEPSKRKLAKAVRRLRAEGSALVESISAETLRDLGL